MNLGETVRALEAKGVTVAINLGAHQSCDLDSNCPLAIQLRRLITSSGITLEQLLEGYQTVIAPHLIVCRLPQFSAKLHLNIAGKVVELDFNNVISGELRGKVRSKLEELDGMKASIRGVGENLYQSYLSEIARQRSKHTLPQLTFSIGEILRTSCLITSEGRNYIFIFPIEYNPQYIVSRGIRYKLPDGDIRNIKRKAYLEITVTLEDRIVSVQLLDSHGRKLEHYHGNLRADCWGDVSIPARWDRRLPSLHRLAHSLAISLMTINKDSILRSNPPTMPTIEELFSRSTELGREGQVDTPERQPVRREWGTARRERT